MDPLTIAALVGAAGLVDRIFGGGGKQTTVQTNEISPEQKAFVQRLLQREEQLRPAVTDMLTKRIPQLTQDYARSMGPQAGVYNNVMASLTGKGYQPMKISDMLASNWNARMPGRG